MLSKEMIEEKIGKFRPRSGESITAVILMLLCISCPTDFNTKAFCLLVQKKYWILFLRTVTCRLADLITVVLLLRKEIKAPENGMGLRTTDVMP